MSLILKPFELLAGRPCSKTAVSPPHAQLPGTSSPSSATSCWMLNRANPPVHTGQVRAHRQIVLASLQAQAVPGASRCGPRRHRVVGRLRRTRRDRQWRDGLRQDDRGWSPRPPCSTPKATAVTGSRHPTWFCKWRREIQETVAGAKVWVLNGPDTCQALKLREQLRACRSGVLRPGRADGWVPLKTVFAQHRTPPWRRGSVPDWVVMSSPTRRRAGQPGRAGSRGVPPRCSHYAAPLWTLICSGEARPPADRPPPSSKPSASPPSGKSPRRS